MMMPDTIPGAYVELGIFGFSALAWFILGLFAAPDGRPGQPLIARVALRIFFAAFLGPLAIPYKLKHKQPNK